LLLNLLFVRLLQVGKFSFLFF